MATTTHFLGSYPELKMLYCILKGISCVTHYLSAASNHYFCPNHATNMLCCALLQHCIVTAGLLYGSLWWLILKLYLGNICRDVCIMCCWFQLLATTVGFLRFWDISAAVILVLPHSEFPRPSSALNPGHLTRPWIALCRNTKGKTKESFPSHLRLNMTYI